MEQTEVERRLQVVYDKCLKCLRDTGFLQDNHAMYGIHNSILRALEAGAQYWETRMQIRKANEAYLNEKQTHEQ